MAPESAEVGQLKKDLEGYRELLLPLNRVLEWEQSYYPAVLVGIITLKFAYVCMQSANFPVAYYGNKSANSPVACACLETNQRILLLRLYGNKSANSPVANTVFIKFRGVKSGERFLA